MSGRIRVVNTAPLIFLAKLRRLELLQLGTDEIYVPPAVLFELRAVPDQATQAVESILGRWITERACRQSRQVDLIAQSLDSGEAEVIALALELDTTDVVLDDLDARRFARQAGLQPIGTLGLLLAAKRHHLLDAVQPEIDALQAAGFRVSQTLVERVLAEAGE